MKLYSINRNYRVSIAVKVHVKFSQLMSSISSSQRRVDEKLAQIQEEVRLGQKDVAAKATIKPIMITVVCRIYM